MDWTGVDCTSVDWTRMDGAKWTGLDWTGVDWAGGIGLEWTFFVYHITETQGSLSRALIVVHMHVPLHANSTRQAHYGWKSELPDAAN